jgi:hypothetical protein
MQRILTALGGAAALALSSAAGAAVTVTASTDLNDPNPTAPGSVVTNNGITTINFGQNPLASGAFTATFTFNNTLADLYSIVLSTSTPGVTFSDASLSGGTCTVATCTLGPFPDNTSLKLANAMLGVGTYTFNLTGNNANMSGALTGNVTISAAPVPEAATWAMMILGFGMAGVTLRRRRTPLAA